MQFFVHCIDAWIQVPRDVWMTWEGAKGTHEMKESNMKGDAEGWVIEKQSKRYGAFVKVSLNGSLQVEIAQNPAGLILDVQALADQLEPTRKNADKLGFLLDQLFQELERMKRKDLTGTAVLQFPSALTEDDAPEEELGRAPTRLRIGPPVL